MFFSMFYNTKMTICLCLGVVDLFSACLNGIIARLQGGLLSFLCTVIEGVCVFADIVKVSPEVVTSGDGKK